MTAMVKNRKAKKQAWKAKELAAKDVIIVPGEVNDTDIVIPYVSIRRRSYGSVVYYFSLRVMGPTGVGKSTVCRSRTYEAWAPY
jgi:hypothetical protein